jgi:dihydrofolate synthase/folylpolyglutamate synthase
MNPLKNKVSAPGLNATLDDWLAYIEAMHPVEIDLGLDRVLIVLRKLFPSPPSARIVTVGGTNGKGSTIACLEALLRDQGRKVGAYTSPHLHRYNERVRVNGLDASDESLVEAFSRVEAARGNISLTYFEFGTLAAFLLLEQAGLDDWLLEIGLGGRLDAVNVLDPDLAIITSVDIDHIGFLGDNREVIGFEKAGIFRPGITAICADPEPPASVLQQASAQRVRLLRDGDGYQLSRKGVPDTLTIGEGESLRLPQSPLPSASMAAGLVAIRALEPDYDLARGAGVLGDVTVPGRMERLADQPRVFADVGHNPHAARWLADEINRQKTGGCKVYAVYAALADKDVEGVADAMSAVVDSWYLAGLSVPRGLTGEDLHRRISGALQNQGAASVVDTVSHALEAVREQARPEDLVIIFGSFFTVGEVRLLLQP